MKEYTIYTAGGMGKFEKENFHLSNSWRQYCKNLLEQYDCDYKVKVINPNSYFNFVDDIPKYKNNKEVMKFDLYKVRTSDLIIVNFNDMYSLGTMAEISIAYEKRIPIIGLDIENQALHPWQIEMCNRIFADIDDMLFYIKDYYLS